MIRHHEQQHGEQKHDQNSMHMVCTPCLQIGLLVVLRSRQQLMTTVTGRSTTYLGWKTTRDEGWESREECFQKPYSSSPDAGSQERGLRRHAIPIIGAAKRM